MVGSNDIDNAIFTIAKVIHRQRASGNTRLISVDLPRLWLVVYTCPAGTNDTESHGSRHRDKAYICVKAKGRPTAGGDVFDVAANSIIFVTAGVEHHFLDATDDLNVLAFLADIRQ